MSNILHSLSNELNTARGTMKCRGFGSSSNRLHEYEI